MKSIFYDPSGKRSRLMGIFFGFLISLGILSICIFVASLIIAPELTSMQTLSDKITSYHLKKSALKIPKELPHHQSGSLVNPDLTPETENILKIHAFGVEWDDGSKESLIQNLKHIDDLILEEFTITSSGTLHTLSPDRYKKTLEYVRKNNPNQTISVIINNYDNTSLSWDSQLLKNLLTDPEKRNKIENRIIEQLNADSLSSVTFDFENIDDTMLPMYYEFLEEFHKKINLSHKTLNITVPISNDSYDFERIGAAVDMVLVMAYDEHWLTGEAGPIASMDWFNDGVMEMSRLIPKNKITVILGNYGYDWNIEKKTTETLTFQETMSLAKESENTIDFDTGSLNPGFGYTDENGNTHEVWYLDAVTANNEINFLKSIGIKDIGLWRLGSEDPSIWNLFGGIQGTSIKNFGYGYSLTYDGVGELYRVSQLPRDGKRTIIESGGLITGESVTDYPLPYRITRYGGGNPKKVVLTFDDGPDPIYTPQILDILKKYKASAIFFMIGMNAEKYPDMVKRVVDEGHFLGNHSFSHPEIAKLGERHTDLELTLTERVFETITGHETSLFRPPYGEDVEPEMPSDMAPLIRANTLGYISVGMKLDPSDWSRPGVDAIINNTLKQLDDERGNILLLHDAGGDRSETVSALPRLIESIRAKGYEIIPISDLIGMPKKSIMPQASSQETFLILWDKVFFYIISTIMGILILISAIGIYIGALRLSIMLGFLWNRQRNTHVQKSKKQPPGHTLVSIIVPAYNEEKVIIRTLESLLKSSYKHYEILVIDDGSTDMTYQITRDYISTLVGVDIAVYRKKNAGKGIAINYGIEHARGDIVIIIDADTLFDTHTVDMLMQEFDDPTVGAVSGNVKVGNQHTLLTRLQAIEYITSQNLDRRAYEGMNAITIVPGAVGAWKKDFLQKVGGFSHETLAEDSDITYMFLKAGYRVTYAPHAYAYTEAPESWGAFYRQRFRWSYGILQVTWKHRDIFGNKQTSVWLRYFTFPYMILTQTIFPICAPIIDAIALVGGVIAICNYFIFDSVHYLHTVITIIMMSGILLSIELLIGLIAFSFEKKESKILLIYLPIQKIVYRFFMYYVGLRALYRALSGHGSGWDKLERTNTVAIQKNL